MISTEVQNLDEAIDIIAGRQRAKKRSAAMQDRPLTLRQQFAGANGRAALLKRHGKISLAGGQTSRNECSKPKLPHPLRDPPEQMEVKARETWATGRWGFGALALQTICRAFGVTKGQMVVWLDGVVVPL